MAQWPAHVSRILASALVVALLAWGSACAASNGGSGASADSAGASNEQATSSGEESASSASAQSASTASASTATVPSSRTTGRNGAGSTVSDDEPEVVIAPYGKSFPEWPEECLDARDNPTLYALFNLEGWQFETMLVHLGCTYDDGQRKWTSEEGIVFGAVGENGTLDDQGIANLHRIGSQVPVIYVLSIPGYDSARDVLYAGNVVIDDQYYLPDGSAIAVAHGSSLARAFVMVYRSNEQYTVMVATQQAVETGLFAHTIDSEIAQGMSISEMWELLTGSPIGSNES